VLRAEQGWCLECGLAARTRLHPPPRWRIPIATTLVLLALLAAGISLALVALLDNKQTATPAATVTVPATTPGAPTTSAPATTVPQTTTPSTTTPGSVPSATVPPVTVPGSALPPKTTP
jgi:hypothetical protein